MATIEPYAAKTVYDPPGYAQAVKVTGAQTILYIAGQVAYTPEGGVAHAGDFKAQARACLAALKAQVEAGGGTMANIVKVNTYLTDLRHRADFGPIREEFFGRKLPASTMVGVTALAHPDYLIEIEAVAVL
ncbi:MAG TPA: RidA family protein [Stellaceae bacterium]|nr:RidA family protein [Stellaceae bacterium]